MENLDPDALAQKEEEEFEREKKELATRWRVLERKVGTLQLLIRPWPRMFLYAIEFHIASHVYWNVCILGS